VKIRKPLLAVRARSAVVRFWTQKAGENQGKTIDFTGRFAVAWPLL
jgi:hypothetical protein